MFVGLLGFPPGLHQRGAEPIGEPRGEPRGEPGQPVISNALELKKSWELLGVNCQISSQCHGYIMLHSSTRQWTSHDIPMKPTYPILSIVKFVHLSR